MTPALAVLYSHCLHQGEPHNSYKQDSTWFDDSKAKADGKVEDLGRTK